MKQMMKNQAAISIKKSLRIIVSLSFSVIFICFGGPAQTHASEPTQAEILTKILLDGTDAIYRGDYDTAWLIFDRISKFYPDHPSREFYLTTVLFWKTNTDPNDPVYDDRIVSLLERCIKKCEVLLSKDPLDIEALHYIGLAYTYWGRLDAHRGRYYAGGVKGETGREYLEQGIALCSPSRDVPLHRKKPGKAAFCEDLYFPLGAYSYFAGRLPSFLKALNFLWFLPKGSTEEGLSGLKRASRNSMLHDMSAKLLLISIFRLFEKEHLPKAFKMSETVVNRYPENPYLALQHGDILMAAGKYETVILHAENILSKVQNNHPYYDKGVGLQAKLIIAETLIYIDEVEKGRLLLTTLLQDQDYLNHTYTSKIYLLLGMTEDVQHKRAEALKIYAITLDQDERCIDRITKKRARQYLKTPFSIPNSL